MRWFFCIWVDYSSAPSAKPLTSQALCSHVFQQRNFNHLRFVTTSLNGSCLQFFVFAATYNLWQLRNGG